MLNAALIKLRFIKKRNEQLPEESNETCIERPKSSKSSVLRHAEASHLARRRPRETLSNQPAQSRFSTPILASHRPLPSKGSRIQFGESALRPKSARSAKSLPVDSVSSFGTPRCMERPSPLAMNPLDLELLEATNRAVGLKSMSKVPSLPAIEIYMRDMEHEASREASPQDTNPSRPKTAGDRPRSYLPRLQFPGDLLGDTFSLPSSLSILTEDSSLFTVSPTEVTPISPATSVIAIAESPGLPKGEANERPQGQKPAPERPMSRRILSVEDIPIPPIPRTYYVQSKDLTENIPHPRIEKASIYQTPKKYKSSPQLVQIPASHHRTDSSPLSKKSNHTSPDLRAAHARSRSAGPNHTPTSSSTVVPPASMTSPTQMASRSRKRSPLRPRNSIDRHHEHIRKSSSTQTFTERRHSKERDQLYYDPASSRRTRSGSIQGRSVDFDAKRESPFLDAVILFPQPPSAREIVKSRKAHSPDRPTIQVRQSTWPLLPVDIKVEHASMTAPVNAVHGSHPGNMPEPPKIRDDSERPVSAGTPVNPSSTLASTLQSTGKSWPKEGPPEDPRRNQVNKRMDGEDSQSMTAQRGVFAPIFVGDRSDVPSFLVPGKPGPNEGSSERKKAKVVELLDSPRLSMKQEGIEKENKIRPWKERRIDSSRSKGIGNGEGLELFDFFDY